MGSWQFGSRLVVVSAQCPPRRAEPLLPRWRLVPGRSIRRPDFCRNGAGRVDQHLDDCGCVPVGRNPQSHFLEASQNGSRNLGLITSASTTGAVFALGSSGIAAINLAAGRETELLLPFSADRYFAFTVLGEIGSIGYRRALFSGMAIRGSSVPKCCKA